MAQEGDVLQRVQRAERIDAGVLVLADHEGGDHHGSDSCQEHVELGGLGRGLGLGAQPVVPLDGAAADAVGLSVLPTP